MKHLTLMAVLGLLVSGLSYAKQAEDNCEAISSSSRGLNPKADMGSSTQTKTQSTSTSTARR